MTNAASRRRWIGVACIATAWLALVGVLALRGRLSVVMNADLALFPVMSIDLARWGGQWSEWKVGHIPYTFPDLTLFRLVDLFLGIPQTSVVVAGLLMPLLAVAGWSVLGARVVKGAAVRVLVLVLLPVLECAIFCISVPGDPVRSIEVSVVHHGGILVMAPWALLLGREVAFVRRPRRACLALAFWTLFAVVGIGSDRLSLLQVFAPGALLTASVALVTPGRAVAQLGALVVATALGMTLERLLLPQPVAAALRPAGTTFLSVVASAFRLLGAQWTGSPVGVTLLVIAMLGSVTLPVLAWRSGRLARESLANLCLIGSFPLVALAAVVGGAAIAGPPFEQSAIRHIAFSFVVTVPCAAIVATGFVSARALVFDRFPVHVLVAPCALALVVVGALGSHPSRDKVEAHGGGVVPSWQLATARCLESETSRRGLTDGLADYWDAKLFSLLSGGRLRMIQLDSELRNYDWVSNVRWANRLSPEFVLVGKPELVDHKPQRTDVVRTFGAPSESFECLPMEVLVYRAERREPFEEAWRTRHDNSLAAKGEHVTFAASALPGNIGVVDGGARVATGDVVGALTFGPMLHVVPGAYEATVVYESASAADGTEPGTWDVCVHHGTRESIPARGPLPAGGSPFTLHFDIDEASTVEVRTFFTGKGVLRVRKIAFSLEVVRER